MPYDLDDAVCPVGDRRLSIRDLLSRFGDETTRDDGVPRLSDLHLKVGEPPRYRFDNELLPLEGAAPLGAEAVERLVLPMLSGPQRARLAESPPLDVDAGFALPERGLSFRLNAFRDRDGVACAIRFVPACVPDVTRIGFPDDAVWREIVDLAQGLVIVTGITGSGKSTTVASMLQRIAGERAVRIVTLEDPVEYVLRGGRAMVSQRELGKHFRSFGEGLRSALREDPDVLFVGEMRDLETTALALSAAETGHLVVSTLHTRDARGALTRIVDLFPTDRVREIATQLSFGLRWVLAQKLVPRRDCGGRRVAMEVLRNIPAVANLVRSCAWQQLYSAMEANRRFGLLPLERHLERLVRDGAILPDVARRFANDPSVL